MPYNWLRLSNTPPEWEDAARDPHQFKERIAQAVTDNGGRLEYVLWSAHEAVTCVLTHGPDDAVRQKKLMRALPTLDLTVLIDEDEAVEAFGCGDGDTGAQAS